MPSARAVATSVPRAGRVMPKASRVAHPKAGAPVLERSSHGRIGRVVMAAVDNRFRRRERMGGVARLYVGGVECLEESRPALVP
jgi:hypothetical protein